MNNLNLFPKMLFGVVFILQNFSCVNVCYGYTYKESIFKYTSKNGDFNKNEKMDALTDTFEVNDIPIEILINSERKIAYFIQENSYHIKKMNLSTGDLENIITLDNQPSQILLSSDGNTLYVNYRNSQLLTIIDIPLAFSQSALLFHTPPRKIAIVDKETIASIEQDSRQINLYSISGVFDHVLNAQNNNLPLNPPRNFQGKQVINKFINKTEYVNVLTWDPPFDRLPIAYKIYNDANLKNLIVEIKTEKSLMYEDIVKKNKTKTYYIVSVYSEGCSEVVSLAVIPKKQK